MNDSQNADMRALLSHAAPAPEEEPHARDVIGPAMAWGDRRRRLDRIMAGAGAALAVVAIGAVSAGMGNESSGGVKTVTGTPTPAGISSSGSGVCMLRNGHPGSTELCSTEVQLADFNHDFTQGAFPLLSGKLPAGVTATNNGAFYVELSKGDTTEYLYPSIAFRSTLDGGKEHCANPDCSLQPLLSGTAALGVRGGATMVDWVADAGDGPRVTVVLTNSPPATFPLYAGDPLPSAGGFSQPPATLPDGKLSPPPPSAAAATQPVKLMTAQQIAGLVSDPGFQQYTTAQYAKLKDLNQKYQRLMATELPSNPGGYISGSIPAGGSDPAKPPATPGSLPSGMPFGTPTGMPSGSPAVGPTSHR